MTIAISMVTGSSSGIGAALCEQLLQAGGDLIVLNRDEQKTQDQVRDWARQYPDSRVFTYLADFADQASIRSACAKIGERHKSIDALYIVAGHLSDQAGLSKDGLERHFAVNCVAPVLLAALLRPQLAAAKPSRVVVAGSAARRMVRELDPSAFFGHAIGGGMQAYAQSKQAVTVAFALRRADYARDGIALHVVDIAPTRTGMASSKALPAIFRLGRFLFTTPQKSAARLLAAGAGGGEAGPVVRGHAADGVAQTALLQLLDAVAP